MKSINPYSSFLLISLFTVLLTFGCRPEVTPDESPTVTFAELVPDRPNILWLVTEDMGPYIPPFGDSTIQTPNLSRLAAQGIRYPRLFSPSGVCAPSRAAISTGMYASSIGGNHMRTGSYTEVTGLPAYEAVPPPEVRMMSEILRRNGYYCSNNAKQDYQFKAPVTAWDESSNKAHWRQREPGQAFFSIFNFGVTHESGLFEPYKDSRTERKIPKDLDFSIPPYLPETDSVRRDMWKVYNNIVEMDRQVGDILDQLEADGLLDSTIIFFYGDHGGPLPRQKRLIYDSGLNTPLIIRFPGEWRAGTIDDQLLSFIDLAPTVFSMVGIEPPAYLQGQAFLGKYQAEAPRDYIHAAADRFDGFTDAIRAVRDERFKYIRNYRPEQGYYLPVVYRERIPTMRELLRMRDTGELNEYQAQWFRSRKPPEELFDCENDPHELHNIINDPQYADKLAELRAEMDRWLEAIGDQPNLPERELINQLWNGREKQPLTDDPKIAADNGQITLSCPTEGASIGYKIIPAGGEEPPSWSVYTGPFAAPAGSRVQVQAHRIGFVPSEVVAYEVP